MYQVFRDVELSTGSFSKVIPCLLKLFGMELPYLNHFAVNTERCNARTYKIFVPGFCHEGKMPGNYCHCCFKRHNIRMESYACTSCLGRVIVYIFPQNIAKYFVIDYFGCRKEILPDATTGKIIMVVSDFFLVLFPDLIFTVFHTSVFFRIKFLAGCVRHFFYKRNCMLRKQVSIVLSVPMTWLT